MSEKTLFLRTGTLRKDDGGWSQIVGKEFIEWLNTARAELGRHWLWYWSFYSSSG